MRFGRAVVVVLSATLAACGEKPPAPAAAEPVAHRPVAPPAPAPTPPSPSPATEKSPAPPVETPKVQAPKPSVVVTRDASGHDWASHMGDIPFALDPAAAMDAAAKANRPMMLYFTSPG